MADPEIPATLWFLSGTTLFLLLLVWIGQHRLRSQLRRIEDRLSTTGIPSTGGMEASLSDRKGENREQKRLYQEFLDEEPARKDLAKKEQFAAFRKWRKDRGLNWNAGDEKRNEPA
jgi:hypothetical protein